MAPSRRTQTVNSAEPRFLNLPGRDPTQSKLFVVENHPQRAGIPGTAYVYIQDTSVKGLAETWEHEKGREVPSGTLVEILASGSQDPKDDMIQAWVTGGRVITPAMNECFDAARDKFLGSRHLRTRKRPKKPTNRNGNRIRGECTGGIAYERTKICKPVQEGSRCYTLGPSGKAPTSIVAPVASAKMSTEEVDPDAANWQELLRASAEIAAAAFQEAPPQVRERTQEIASLVNVPSIGVHNNYAYATAQANVATAKRGGGKSKAPSLALDMGFFGAAHVDRKDGHGHFSHMSANSDLPEGSDYTPGFFFILQLGVFILLDRHTSINFSGLRRHGGTPPLCGTGRHAKLHKFAYRFVIIFYPPSRMMDGTARYTLGAMPNNEAFIFPPEMLHAGVSNKIAKGWPKEGSCDRASFVHEGVLMMCQRSLVTFIVRSLLLMCYYFLLQLPARYQIRLDPDLFLQSITMVLDNRRVNTGAWDFAPGHRLPANMRAAWVGTVDCPDDQMIDQDQVRSDAWARWDEWVAKASAHIPCVGRHGPPKYSIPNPSKAIVPSSNIEDGYEAADEDAPEPPKRPKCPKAKAPPKPRKARRKAKHQRKRRRPRAVDGSPKPLPAAAESNNHEMEQDHEQSADAEDDNAHEMEQDHEQSADAEDNNAHETNRDDGPNAALLKRPRDTSPAVKDPRGQPPNKRLRKPHSVDIEPVWASPSRHSARHAIAASTPGDWMGPVLEASDEENATAMASTDRELLVETITLNSINRNLHDVQTAWTMASITAPSDSDPDTFDQAYSALMKRPDASSTASHFQTIWRRLDSMNSEQALNMLRTRLDREQIMLTTLFAWRWLDAYCPHEIQTALTAKQNHTPPSTWIGKLACDVVLQLERRTTQHIFQPATYSLEISAEAFVFSRPRVTLLSPDELVAAVIRHTCQIIAAWLQFPVRGVSRYQAWLVYSIVRTIGHPVLLLDEVWRAFTQVGNTHPLVDGSSAESHALHRIVDIIALTRAPAAAMPPAHTDPCPFSPYPPLEPSPSSRPSLSHAEARANAATTPIPPSNSAVTASGRLAHPPLKPVLLPSEISKDRDVLAKLDRFKRFMDEALEAARMPELANPTMWQTKMLSDMDRFLPFPRACAISTTNHGFLSALIFRVITYNTDFSERHAFAMRTTLILRRRWNELQTSFWQLMAARLPLLFFCNQGAYGPHNTGRTVDLAEVYGQLVGKENIASQLAQQPSRSNIPFTTFWKWLKGSVNGRLRFHQLGPLGSYLLAADYTYTTPRLVAPPTFEELGTIICDMNKGAVRGLEILGLIPACATLCSYWSSEVQEEVWFDLVMIEHCLCKLARAYKLGYFEI
ncbi:hypothetical protein B0H14DRAFT_3535517 [Mycena olivaceomarginata]|nr:hypothetical protein B0H14DRAFT_3535517 [Mycena olivaceomarginata]